MTLLLPLRPAPAGQGLRPMEQDAYRSSGPAPAGQGLRPTEQDACRSSGPAPAGQGLRPTAFLMMYSAYKLNKQGDNIQS